MPPSLLRQLDQPECGTECGAWGGLELAWYVPGALPQRRVVWMWFGAFPGGLG